MTVQLCSVSFQWHPTNNLTSLPVDLWGRGRNVESVLGVVTGRDAGTSSVGTVLLMLAQIPSPHPQNACNSDLHFFPSQFHSQMKNTHTRTIFMQQTKEKLLTMYIFIIYITDLKTNDMAHSNAR